MKVIKDIIMIKQLLKLGTFVVVVSALAGCSKINNVPEVSQPLITQYAQKSTVTVGDTTINTGPLKDYEQESDIVYKLTVTSKEPLKKFTVTTTSDAFSLASKVLRTEPANAIDANGNFRQPLTSVVVYYAYRIHPLVAPLSVVTVTFTFQNERNYVGTSGSTFTVIKKGSTSGKLLTVIELSGVTRTSGIGWQDNMDIQSGARATVDPNFRKGSFYSIPLRTDLATSGDVLNNADKIDFAGYVTRFAGTNPVLTNNAFYLVSLSDTTVLTSTYAGAQAASLAIIGSSGTANFTVAGLTKTATYVTSTTQTATNFVTANAAAYSAIGLTLTSNAAVLLWTAKTPNVGFGPVIMTNVSGTLDGNEIRYIKNDLEASIIRQVAAKLKAAGKSLRKVYFQRLDNISGVSQVTPAYFDQLTHDNEFDVLLGGVVAGGKTNIGPIGLGQVYGFVMDDGRRGLIKTSAALGVNSSGVSVPITAPFVNLTSDNVLFCTIKVQENK
jgi:hypothetical protein